MGQIAGHELFDTWAKAQDLFYQRAEQMVDEALEAELPDCDLTEVNGLDYDPEDDSVVIVGHYWGWCSMDDNDPGYDALALFRVSREEFLDPEVWEARLAEHRKRMEWRDAEARKAAEERERAEYLRLKAKFEQ